jgi:hypothetical protein
MPQGSSHRLAPSPLAILVFPLWKQYPCLGSPLGHLMQSFHTHYPYGNYADTRAHDSVTTHQRCIHLCQGTAAAASNQTVASPWLHFGSDLWPVHATMSGTDRHQVHSPGRRNLKAWVLLRYASRSFRAHYHQCDDDRHLECQVATTATCIASCLFHDVRYQAPPMACVRAAASERQHST